MAAMADEIGHGADAHPAAAQEPAGVGRVHGPPPRALASSAWPTRWPGTRRCGRRCTTSRTSFRALDVPVLLALGDEDGPCLETNLMLKRAIPGAGLWIHPHTGHAINLEEPAAFNAMVESFLADVERPPATTTVAH